MSPQPDPGRSRIPPIPKSRSTDLLHEVNGGDTLNRPTEMHVRTSSTRSPFRESIPPGQDELDNVDRPCVLNLEDASEVPKGRRSIFSTTFDMEMPTILDSDLPRTHSLNLSERTPSLTQSVAWTPTRNSRSSTMTSREFVSSKPSHDWESREYSVENGKEVVGESRWHLSKKALIFVGLMAVATLLLVLSFAVWFKQSDGCVTSCSPRSPPPQRQASTTNLSFAIQYLDVDIAQFDDERFEREFHSNFHQAILHPSGNVTRGALSCSIHAIVAGSVIVSASAQFPSESDADDFDAELNDGSA
eukprot:3375579-Pyramimonas_sp.AAC.1